MKIKEEELKQLKSIQQKNQKIIIQLGEISLNEILLINKKNELIEEIKSIQIEEKTLKEYLISCYGDNLNINIETGDY